MSSNLTSLTAGTVPLAGADLLYGVQGGNSRKFPAGAIGATHGARVGMINGTIAHSRVGNAETINVKTLAGSDPSAADPVLFVFQDGAGGYVLRSVTGTLLITIPSTATMGATNGIAFRIWVGALDNSGTVELFVVNALNAASPGVRSLSEALPYTTTGTPASTAQVLYSTTGRTSKFICLLSFANWDSGLATAGTWNAAPTNVILFGSGMQKPGELVQVAVPVITTADTTTSSTFVAGTNARTTITPISIQNLVHVSYTGSLGTANGAVSGTTCRLSRGTTNNTNLIGNFAYNSTGVSGGVAVPGRLDAYDLPRTASPQTYAVQTHSDDNITAVGANLSPGGGNSTATMVAEEIMV